MIETVLTDVCRTLKHLIPFCRNLCFIEQNPTHGHLKGRSHGLLVHVIGLSCSYPGLSSSKCNSLLHRKWGAMNLLVKKCPYSIVLWQCQATTIASSESNMKKRSRNSEYNLIDLGCSVSRWWPDWDSEPLVTVTEHWGCSMKGQG